jgi:hypothetical protein
MLSLICALAIMATLTGAAIGVFALLVIGIQKGDRGGLFDSPRSNSDSAARHCLVGIRNDSPEDRQ